jgi:hypothetical protein
MGPGPKPKPDDVRGTSTVWKPIVTNSAADDKRGYTKGGHLVMMDDRESWNWQTHYKHIFVPQPQVRADRAVAFGSHSCLLSIRLRVRSGCGRLLGHRGLWQRNALVARHSMEMCCSIRWCCTRV